MTPPPTVTSNHADPGQIFRPESNRLCKFFEISSLTLSLAPRGGFQGKAGFVRLPGSNTSRRSNQPGMSPLSWFTDRSPKWFTIRDSYFVATDGPEAVGLLFSPIYIHLSPSFSYLFISMRPFADQCLSDDFASCLHRFLSLSKFTVYSVISPVRLHT
jgi:hypothetical protein